MYITQAVVVTPTCRLNGVVGGGGEGLAWLGCTELLAVNIGIHASAHHGRKEWRAWLHVRVQVYRKHKNFVMKIVAIFYNVNSSFSTWERLLSAYTFLPKDAILVSKPFQRSSNIIFRLRSEHLMLGIWCHEILFEEPKNQISTFVKVLMVFTVFWLLFCEENQK